MDFVHLHTHSHYSLLDGLAKIDDLILAAKERNMKALALTDHGVMYGVIEFYQKAVKAGIKPIIGVEAYILPYGKSIKDQANKINYHHIILLAQNNAGYENLIKLITIANLEGFYYKPRLDWDILQAHQEGLIVLSACLRGEVADAIVNNQFNKAESLARKFASILGENNFYLEIQPHNIDGKQNKVNVAMRKINQATAIPLVATNDVHYLKTEDDQAHDILLCLGMKRKKSDKDRLSMLGEDFSFVSGEEMNERLKDFPDAIANTVAIANRCEVKIPLGGVVLPTFPTPHNEDPFDYLKNLCQLGLQKRFGDNASDKEVIARMDYELSIIKKMGFATYFLVVEDFVRWAKSQGIVVGPARGSAASSLVSYLLNITSINPLEYNLLFERFLNPDRISPPDFDIDFTDVRRGEVIHYVEEKYGQDHVAQIITFGTMAARAAVRDVGRVLGMSYNFCDQIAKFIPMFMKLDDALKNVPELQEIYDNNEEGRLLIDYAKRLEGVARHSSTHACGVLITPQPLTAYTPVQYASSEDRALVSQYSLHPVEDLGLLKIDFLGLKNLTILETALEIIKKIHGQELDINHLPLNDKKTFALLQQGNTTGVFQLESAGMKRYLKQLKPTHIKDIIAMVALYRPGPMELIPDYIAGKNKQKQIKYLIPQLKPILEETYGIAVYQEQVMQMARTLAGFTYAETDVLRKAVGKKIKKLLDEQKNKMIAGMVKNGIDEITAQMIWQFIEPFARYGFNRAHASGYAMIAYETAYLKAHFPTEFMAALLTADQNDTDRISFLVEECAKMGIEVLPPDINESFSNFTVVVEALKSDKPRIRFGLLAIKNVGEGIVKEIINERKARDVYKSLENFLERVKSKDLNKKSLESLIKSGALDKFGERNKMIHNMESLLGFVKEMNRSNGNQVNLFESMNVMLPHQLVLKDYPPASKKDRLTWEKELLGLYVSEHPFSEFREALKSILTGCGEAGKIGQEGLVAFGGVISGSKRVITKNGDAMLFVKLEDETGNLEVIVFPKLFARSSLVWQGGGLVVVIGRLSDKEGEIKLLADKVAELNQTTLPDIIKQMSGRNISSGEKGRSGQDESKRVILRVSQDVITVSGGSLRELFVRYPGKFHVYLNIIDEHKPDEIKKNIMTSYYIDYNENIKNQIEELVFPGVVSVEDLS